MSDSPATYRALGLMSGTSLDGVDAAVIETDGERIFGFGDVAEASFSAVERKILSETTQDALKWRFNGPPPNSFGRSEQVIHQVHRDVIDKMDMAQIDVIGFHGQTILHHPPTQRSLGQTLQLGNGQVLADRYDVPCAFDFRTADVAAGGQGAPLAPIYHQALCRYSNLSGRVAVVNIGGVSNLTLVTGDQPLIATDCGPGNGVMDSLMEARTGQPYDKNGQVSSAGQVNFSIVDQWLKRDFFNQSIPKSADRHDFDVLRDLADMSLEDSAATLACFSVQAIMRVLENLAADQVIICGGGRRNSTLMNMLRAHLGGIVQTAESVGWNGDMLEAQAFAYLAVRTLRELPISFPGTTGAPKPMMGGRVAYPSSSFISRGGQ